MWRADKDEENILERLFMIRLPFTDRAEAGRLLAAEFVTHKLQGNIIVLALPRGGLPVGLEVMFDLKPFPYFRGQRFIVRHFQNKSRHVIAEFFGQFHCADPGIFNRVVKKCGDYEVGIRFRERRGDTLAGIPCLQCASLA